MDTFMTIYTIPPEIENEKHIRLLKVSDVARMMQISPSQVYTMIQEGALPAVRFGTALRVRPEDLQKFIEENITVVRWGLHSFHVLHMGVMDWSCPACGGINFL
jgi:excisionase family DNA binding protein